MLLIEDGMLCCRSALSHCDWHVVCCLKFQNLKYVDAMRYDSALVAERLIKLRWITKRCELCFGIRECGRVLDFETVLNALLYVCDLVVECCGWRAIRTMRLENQVCCLCDCRVVSCELYPTIQTYTIPDGIRMNIMVNNLVVLSLLCVWFGFASLKVPLENCQT